MKRYVVTNPRDVVKMGRQELMTRIKAGKHEVENDIASFIYYPCLAVVKDYTSYADITAAFNYMGYSSRKGMTTFIPERLIRFFDVVKEDEGTIFVRFNSDYHETDSDIIDARKKAAKNI